MTADVADLCALCDGVSLLWAEVRQDVCRVPLTGVMNSWTSCIQKNKTQTCQQKVAAAVSQYLTGSTVNIILLNASVSDLPGGLKLKLRLHGASNFIETAPA